MRVFGSVEATPAECAEIRAGDDIIGRADVVMDRGFTLHVRADDLWPWIMQLGKRRAGWYLPWRVERFLPRSRRAIRALDGRWTTLRVGDVIPDYGGRHETFTVADIDPLHHLVYRSQRGAATVTWSITLRETAGDEAPQTRVLLRLRLSPIRRVWLARTGGEFLDLLTVAGMAAGLRERLAGSVSR